MKDQFNDLVSINSRKANALHAVLVQRGFNFASGVPCGVLRHIINNIEKDSKIFQGHTEYYR